MLRIGLPNALILTCFGAVANHFGVASDRRGGFEIAEAVPAAFAPTKPSHGAAAPRLTFREVIWRPDPVGVNSFGFIPTEWTVRPQLLPGTWEVRTMFASESRHR
jgi:hypothetical protein